MLNLTWIWLIAGLLLCLLEATLPTAFIALVMGISAIAVAALSLVTPNVVVQISLWLALCALGTGLAKKYLAPVQGKSLLKDAQEGETLTDIPPGQAGRVLYEGNSWRAISADENLAIPAQEQVYIVGRQGNTLIVLPSKF